jgi:hypothetical protein
MVESMKPLADRFIQFPQTEKLLVANGGEDKRRYFSDRPLYCGLVLFIYNCR